MSNNLSALKSELESEGVKYAMDCHVDIHGVPKAKCVSINHFEHMMEGIDAFDSDPWFKEVLGAELVEQFVTIKRAEAKEYHSTMSDWEIKRYARFF